MSVPTTLQGTHDGCGGTVVFRPATHRRELLAGETVVLTAACMQCGATLSTEWKMPAAAIEAHRVRLARAAEQAQELPLAAGAEQWQSQPQLQQRQQQPVARLGDWRLRERSAASAQTVEHDPAMQAYLEQFDGRVASAREHLREASDGLPAAVAQGDGFRTPSFSKGPLLGESVLSARSSIAPAAEDAPVAAPAAAAAVQAALSTPTFLDDEPLVDPAPVIDAAPVVEPAPVFEPIVEATPLIMPEPELEPVLELAPEPVAATELPSEPAQIAATDADVFPPVAAPIEQPLMEAAPVAQAADVWATIPVAAPAPAPAPDPVPMHVDESMQLPAVVAPAPSFAQAFDEAAMAAPAMAAPMMPAPAMPAPIAEPAAVMPMAMPAVDPSAIAAGAAPQLPDASVAYDADRGFDWGGEDEAAKPRKAKRVRRGKRRTPKDSDPAATTEPAATAAPKPEVVFEPAPDADLASAAAPRRVALGKVQLAIVVLLAALCGLAALKVFTTDTSTIAPAPEPAQVSVVPSEQVPSATTDAVPATAPKAKAPNASKTPGNAVADSNPQTLQDAVDQANAQAAANTNAQDPAATADTPSVTTAADDSNADPFARP